MPKRRPAPEISLSFLDVICCGFGAVILLLMITKTVEPQVLEESTVIAEGRVAELTEQLFEIRGETTVLNRDLAAKREQISEFEEQIAILQGSLASSKSRYDSLQTTRNSNSIVAEQLAIARQELSEEEERLLGRDAEKKNQLIGGIPVDSEYIIFIIDNSQSMTSWAWPKVLTSVRNTLTMYPTVKGIQVMNGQGTYLLPRFAGRWIPDDPERRSLILSNLVYWSAPDPSDPTGGITKAIRTFNDGTKKISIYVYGDDFRGGTIERVVRTVDQQNRQSNGADQLIRVHAVGFPQIFLEGDRMIQGSAERFATMIRELAYRNGGTFVALNDYR